MMTRALVLISIGIVPCAISLAPVKAQPPATGKADAAAARALEVLKVGDTAKDVEFIPLKGDAKIKLSDLTKEGPVALIVLRGFPGYQCPICTRQVADLRRNAEQFEQIGAKVVLVYPGPGPAESLKQKANEFLADSELPKPFVMMVDPEYSFTNLYELRWDAPQETAYPSTFVLDGNRVVKFRKVSLSHGDRAPTDEILAALRKIKADAPTAASSKKS